MRIELEDAGVPDAEIPPDYRSREHTEPTQRPQLTIRYVVP